MKKNILTVMVALVIIFGYNGVAFGNISYLYKYMISTILLIFLFTAIKKENNHW